MANTHPLNATSHAHQRDGFTHPHTAIIVRNIHERLHVSPRVPSPVGSTRCLFPPGFRREPLSSPGTISRRIGPSLIPTAGRSLTVSAASSSQVGGASCSRLHKKRPIELQRTLILIDQVQVRVTGCSGRSEGRPSLLPIVKAQPGSTPSARRPSL